MIDNPLLRVEQVCSDLTTTGHRVTFTAVAEAAQIARGSLYRNKDLRAVIDEHRARQTDARTLTGLATEVAHLRSVVETLAATVTKHEERLRRLGNLTDEPFSHKTAEHQPLLAGQCWDNSMAESFFAALKNECVYRTIYPTKDKARQDVIRYIEGFYNPRRRHSAIGYRSPNDVHYSYRQPAIAA